MLTVLLGVHADNKSASAIQAAPIAQHRKKVGAVKKPAQDPTPHFLFMHVHGTYCSCSPELRRSLATVRNSSSLSARSRDGRSSSRLPHAGNARQLRTQVVTTTSAS